jgi:transposase
VQAEREHFVSTQAAMDPDRLVFLDESGFAPGQRLGYGWARRGERAVDVAPLRPRGRVNAIGWFRLSGEGVVATVRHGLRRWDVRGFVEAHLVPHLREGDVVLWDNHRIHEGEGLREAIEAAGARLQPLPRYSPDLDPIEEGWSKGKQHVRRCRADTADAVEAAIAEGVARITPKDIAGWFRHAGYLRQLN